MRQERQALSEELAAARERAAADADGGVPMHLTNFQRDGAVTTLFVQLTMVLDYV